jgi:hypothetical protein
MPTEKPIARMRPRIHRQFPRIRGIRGQHSRMMTLKKVYQPRAWRMGERVVLLFLLLAISGLSPLFAAAPDAAQFVSADRLPAKVHVFEDYETAIEKRWWLRGQPESNNVPPSRSLSLSNWWSCRAAESKDFDDKQGDPGRTYKAVVFNPVPGPPMGARTHLAFRYWLTGASDLRVQIFSLSRNYHRNLTLTNLPNGAWQNVAVDLTRAPVLCPARRGPRGR